MTEQEQQHFRCYTGRRFVRAMQLMLDGQCHSTWKLLLARKAAASWRADLVALGHARDVKEVMDWAEREARNRSKV